MPTPNDTWDNMKIALAQMCDDLAIAAKQAKTLRRTLEEQPPKEVARAAKPRDGTSYLQELLRTCDALDELCSAYREVGDTIKRRTAAPPPRNSGKPRDN